MKFLIVNQDSTAEIYGHTYNLKSVNNPKAGLQDILVADNGSASELLGRHKDVLAAADMEYDKAKDFPGPLNALEEVPLNSKILLLRSGGIGDHMMLLPAIQALKEKYSDRSIRIWMSVQKDMFPIFQGNPYIDRIFPLPIPLNDLFSADYLVDFSQSVSSSVFNEKHPTDYYLDVLGIKQDNGLCKVPTVRPDTAGKPIITELFKILRDEHDGRHLILIQWKASVHLRTFPPGHLRTLTHTFDDVVFISAHHHTQAEQANRDIKEAGLNVLDISYYIRDLRDFLTAVSLIDGVISTDSSAYHVAAALDKPALGLFGAIGSHLRTCYYPKIISIDARYHGKKCHSPCYRHRGTCPEARSLKTPYSPCLMSISEDILCESFKKLLHAFLP